MDPKYDHMQGPSAFFSKKLEQMISTFEGMITQDHSLTFDKDGNQTLTTLIEGKKHSLELPADVFSGIELHKKLPDKISYPPMKN